MALKGNLKDFSLTQLLNLINLARKTGALRLNRPATPVANLFFREGKLTDAGLDGQPSELTTLLFRIGKISAEQQKAILAHATIRTDKEIALLSINAGYVNQADIVQAVRSHLLDTIYLLFTWTDGAFFFEPTVLPSDDRITVPIHLEGVIMEGTRRVQEWEMLQDELPDLDLAMKFTERPNTNLRDINLSVDEWRVISFINSRNSIKQIADVNKMNEFQIRKIVYRMMSAGLVELAHPEGAPPKRLLTRPPTAPPTPAAQPVGPVRRPTPAMAGGPSSVPPTTAPSAPASRSVIMRLINRIKQL
ncbi:MAG: DUF4388 domain-containing protein [Chloroflexota bacterium]